VTDKQVSRAYKTSKITVLYLPSLRVWKVVGRKEDKEFWNGKVAQNS
jgi:hypothetical protein